MPREPPEVRVGEIPDPADTDTATTYAIGIAYALGVIHERDRIAAGIGELEEAWRARADDFHRAAVADRRGGMDPHRTTDWPGTSNMTAKQRRDAYRALMQTWEMP